MYVSLQLRCIGLRTSSKLDKVHIQNKYIIVLCGNVSM